MRPVVVITGIGIISPIGIGASNFFSAAIEGRVSVRQADTFDISNTRTSKVADVQDFDHSLFMNDQQAQRMDRFSRFAVAAAKMALDDSGLQVEEHAHNVGVVIGSAIGGISTHEKNMRLFYEKGPLGIRPIAIPMIMYNAASCSVSMMFQAKGPNLTPSTACTSGANAIGIGMQLIQQNKAEVVIAGGADAPLCKGIFSAWDATRALSPEKCKPFSKNRDGFILGEGAGVVILEKYEFAEKRGARKIYGELCGYGITADAKHLTAPDYHAQSLAIKSALVEANIHEDELDYINAHGTGTLLNDIAETQAIKMALGKCAHAIPISSIKSMTGHCMGASSAIEAIATILTIHHGQIPPTMNYEVVDPECDLDYVPNVRREMIVKTAISNSFAFGGNNTVLAFKKF